MNFLTYIGNNYDHVKSLLSQYKDFDEDVFHSTIIKCNETISLHNLIFTSDNDILRYFIGSYKTNILREKLYYYNKNSINGLEISLFEKTCNDDIELYVDINLIYDDIAIKFNKELAEVFKMYINENVSIDKLLKRSGIKNLKLKIKLIKEYIYEHRSDLMILK